MSSVVKFQALSGVGDDSPPCYLLQVDEFRFMLDCGWDLNADATYLNALRSIAHEVDAILLSFGDMAHLGALPYLVGKCGVRCPIYATLPVQKLGQMFLYDSWQSNYNAGDFDLFNLDDVDAAFERIHAVKYQQTISLKGRGNGLQLTALPAGHMLGGTMWKIVKEGGEEEVVYAVDYNHQKEKHVNGAAFEQATRPSVLITDSSNALYSSVRRIERTEQLITTIVDTLRGGGDVLVATDSAGRCLELCLVLEQLWSIADSGLQQYGLVLLTHTARATLEACRSLIEWCSEKLLAAFEKDRMNPFDLRYVKTAHALDQLASLPSPRLVLASQSQLDAGFSRDLFLQFAAGPQNAIVLTSRPARRSLAARVLQLARAQPRPANTTQAGGDASQPEGAAPQREPFEIDVQVTRRVRLDGEELAEYLRVEAERKQRAFLARNRKRRPRRRDDESDSGSGSGSDSDSDSESDEDEEEEASENDAAAEPQGGDSDADAVKPPVVTDDEESPVESVAEDVPQAADEAMDVKVSVPSPETGAGAPTDEPAKEPEAALPPHLVLSAEQLESIANRTARLSVVHEPLEQKASDHDSAIPFISPTATPRRQLSLQRSVSISRAAESETQSASELVTADDQQASSGRNRNRKRAHDFDSTARRSEVEEAENEAQKLVPLPAKKKQPVSFFKRDQRVRTHLMFAFAEPKCSWDEYGEFLRPNEIRMHDPNALADATNTAEHVAAAAQSAASRREEAGGRKRSPSENAEDAEEEPEIDADWSNNVASSVLLDDVPSKCVSTRQRITVAARIELIELEGRSDGDSVRKIMQQIKPREVILVRGSEAPTRALADFITAISATGTGAARSQSAGATGRGNAVRVHTPRLFELVDASQEGRLMQVRLRDALLGSVQLTQVKNDVQLGWIDALLQFPEADGERRPNRADDLLRGGNTLPTLTSLGSRVDHGTVLVNEPRLSDLKQTLLRNGMSSEFSGGQLIVKDSIAIRKTEMGKLHVEAALSEDFFALREILYSQYVHV